MLLWEKTGLTFYAFYCDHTDAGRPVLKLVLWNQDAPGRIHRFKHPFR